MDDPFCRGYCLVEKPLPSIASSAGITRQESILLLTPAVLHPENKSCEKLCFRTEQDSTFTIYFIYFLC